MRTRHDSRDALVRYLEDLANRLDRVGDGEMARLCDRAAAYHQAGETVEGFAIMDRTELREALVRLPPLLGGTPEAIDGDRLIAEAIDWYDKGWLNSRGVV